MPVVEDIATSIREVARDAGPSVVGLGRGWSVGSGLVLEPGRVLTNAHNIRRDEVAISFLDGRRESGRVLGQDADLDLAVIELETDDAPAVQWLPGTPEPEIGDAIYALGNPGGRGLRVTPGFVSSVARSFRGPRGRRITGAVEHTAPLPRGSSGGPLLDRHGQLIGINAVRVDGGLILAIAADESVRDRVQALSRGEQPRRARLGIAVAPPRVARRLRRAVGLPEREGVLVRAVEKGSPADRGGLERGDLLVKAAGRDLDRVDVLYEALDGVVEAGELELVVVRGTDERTLAVSL